MSRPLKLYAHDENGGGPQWTHDKLRWVFDYSGPQPSGVADYMRVPVYTDEPVPAVPGDNKAPTKKSLQESIELVREQHCDDDGRVRTVWIISDPKLVPPNATQFRDVRPRAIATALDAYECRVLRWMLPDSSVESAKGAALNQALEVLWTRRLVSGNFRELTLKGKEVAEWLRQLERST